MIYTNRKTIGYAKPIIEITPDWFKTYTELAKNTSHHVLLESGRGGSYSIIGLSPWAILKGKNKELQITTKEGTVTKSGSLLRSLREWLQTHKVEKNKELPDFQGGIIGQFSYDIVREMEKLPEQANDDLNTDDILFMAFNEIVLIDHKKDLIWFIAIIEDGNEKFGLETLIKMEKEWKEHFPTNNTYPWYVQRSKPTEKIIERSFTEEQFVTAVKKTQKYITSGDVFQVNLSVRETRDIQTHPLHIYDCLRRVNPSPYMGYFHFPHIQYVGASPELLVKIKEDEVSTRPIAGTRSRGETAEEDLRLANTLIGNEKERAEHIMLVDLERNDLGRVCEYGSVEVNELMVIEKYSHVMHIVSNVRGKKSKKADALDVVTATFPGGTITGAPKIRTMEIIEELEPVRRGAYTGSLGWIGYNGDMEINISIRTMVVKDDLVHVQAGAGIVIDSIPEAEFKESLKKAKALWKAKEMSEEELKTLV
ncbi:anthranilate synthase component I family protein [Evansella tamaricis]|uniref:Anthranilate synthase component I family protein n=1 Tax=Evansella tamaricis TaxID=2069301 RepID=A0ABS6JDS1_9BACI|nr:anthranilate synthase component I family protein [Evansella tamaricis]MBU9710483.1 anthranilate synthase component I family protein [Evansella tamaricis]